MNAPTRVKIEMELTPRWWRKLTEHLQDGSAYKPVRELHAQACEIAFKLGIDVDMLKTERKAFVACLTVPSNASLVTLCEKAGQLVEELNALDISCLSRAKYLSGDVAQS